jgi:hypothetical protein
MELFNIKGNFGMWTKFYKEEINFTKEEDFSVNYLAQAEKCPTISIINVQVDE